MLILLTIFVLIILFWTVYRSITRRKETLILNSIWRPFSRAQRFKLWFVLMFNKNKPIKLNTFKRNFELRFEKMVIRKINEGLVENMDFNSEFKANIRIPFEDFYKTMDLPITLWKKLKPLSIKTVGRVVLTYQKVGYHLECTIFESGADLSFRDIL